MSRLADWYFVRQMHIMGWPKTRGVFKKTPYVPALMADLMIRQCVQIYMGLGAGWPELGARLIADTFSDNPWTVESTAETLKMLNTADGIIASQPDELPWVALWNSGQSLSQVGKDIMWEWLGSREMSIIRASSCAKGAYWGLTHPMEKAFAHGFDKARYENSSRQWASAGLDIPKGYAWPTLESFYETCESLALDFQAQRGPLAPIPQALRQAAPVAARLG